MLGTPTPDTAAASGLKTYATVASNTRTTLKIAAPLFSNPCVLVWPVGQVNPFSIHASVTKYSNVGVTSPTVADIVNGGDEMVTDSVINDNVDNAQSSQQQQQQEEVVKT